MKYVNASEVNTLEELRNALNRPVQYAEDNEVKAIAVIGSNELLNNLLLNSECGVPKAASDLSIIQVDYANDRDMPDAVFVAQRNAAVWELFRRWKKAGFNKRHAKTPFSCKAFTAFIDIDKYCSETTYVVFRTWENRCGITENDKICSI